MKFLFFLLLTSFSVSTLNRSFQEEHLSTENQIINLFNQYKIVAIGEDHSNFTQHQFLHMLISKEEFRSKVDDIVVEFGNSSYQNLVDNYILKGEGEINDLKPVWRNTTQFLVWDSPIYKDFFKFIKEQNDKYPDNKIRVVLGDSPIDWNLIENESDFHVFGQRDDFFVKTIQKEVIDKGRKALMLAGIFHLMKWDLKDYPQNKMLTSVTEILSKGNTDFAPFVIHTIPERASLFNKYKREERNSLLICDKKTLNKSFYQAWGELFMVPFESDEGMPHHVEFSMNNTPASNQFVDAFLWIKGPHQYVEPDRSIINEKEYINTLLKRAELIAPDPFFQDFIKSQIEALRN